MPGTLSLNWNNCPPASLDGALPATDRLAVVMNNVAKSLLPKAQLVTYRAGMAMRSNTFPAVE